MSFGSTMQFLRTGTSAGCGPIPKPIAGQPADTHGMLPEGYAGQGDDHPPEIIVTATRREQSGRRPGRKIYKAGSRYQQGFAGDVTCGPHTRYPKGRPRAPWGDTYWGGNREPSSAISGLSAVDAIKLGKATVIQPKGHARERVGMAGAVITTRRGTVVRTRSGGGVAGRRALRAAARSTRAAVKCDQTCGPEMGKWAGKPWCCPKAVAGMVGGSAAPDYLCDALCTMRAAYLTYRNSHWMVRGPDYYGLHLLFERLYNESKDNIDSLAEQMVGTYGSDAIREDTEHVGQQVAAFAEYGHPLAKALAAAQAVHEKLATAFYAMQQNGTATPGWEDLLGELDSKNDNHRYLLQQASWRAA